MSWSTSLGQILILFLLTIITLINGVHTALTSGWKGEIFAYSGTNIGDPQDLNVDDIGDRYILKHSKRELNADFIDFSPQE